MPFEFSNRFQACSVLKPAWCLGDCWAASGADRELETSTGQPVVGVTTQVGIIRSERIEWFIEGQVLSQSFMLLFLAHHLPPHSPISKLDWRYTGRLRGEGGRGVAEEPNHTTTSKLGHLYKSFNTLWLTWINLMDEVLPVCQRWSLRVWELEQFRL